MKYDKRTVMRLAHYTFKEVQKMMARKTFIENANEIWSICLRSAHKQYKNSRAEEMKAA